MFSTMRARAFAPLARFSEPDLNAAMKEGGRGASAATGTHPLRGLLVVLQIALTLLLLVCAGLLGRNLGLVESFFPRDLAP